MFIYETVFVNNDSRGWQMSLVGSISGVDRLDIKIKSSSH
jgi:hypothetical protein